MKIRISTSVNEAYVGDDLKAHTLEEKKGLFLEALDIPDWVLSTLNKLGLFLCAYLEIAPIEVELIVPDACEIVFRVDKKQTPLVEGVIQKVFSDAAIKEHIDLKVAQALKQVEERYRALRDEQALKSVEERYQAWREAMFKPEASSPYLGTLPPVEDEPQPPVEEYAPTLHPKKYWSPEASDESEADAATVEDEGYLKVFKPSFEFEPIRTRSAPSEEDERPRKKRRSAKHSPPE